MFFIQNYENRQVTLGTVFSTMLNRCLLLNNNLLKNIIDSYFGKCVLLRPLET